MGRTLYLDSPEERAQEEIRLERQMAVCHFEGFEHYHENDWKPLKDFKFQGDPYVSKLGFWGTDFTKDREEEKYLTLF